MGLHDGPFVMNPMLLGTQSGLPKCRHTTYDSSFLVGLHSRLPSSVVNLPTPVSLMRHPPHIVKDNTGFPMHHSVLHLTFRRSPS